MPRILFILPAATVYDAQDRVMGWKHTPSSRQSLKDFKKIISRLQELGPCRVVGSDLDHDSVWLLSRKLRIPYEEWTTLRRLNAGKLHGAALTDFESTFNSIEKPDVPVKGGDSHTSYKKRMSAARARLGQMKDTTVVVAGAREIATMLGLEAKLERGRVYALEVQNAPPAAA